MFYHKKIFLEKAATIKRFEYLPSGQGLKKQISIAEKQYQELHKVCGYDRKVVIKKREFKSGL